MLLPKTVAHRPAPAVHMLDTDPSVQGNTMLLLPILLHAQQLSPIHCAADVIGQQDTVIKRKRFLTEHRDFVFCGRIAQLPVAFHEREGRRSSPYDQYALPGFTETAHGHCGKLEVRLLRYRIYQIVS